MITNESHQHKVTCRQEAGFGDGYVIRVDNLIKFAGLTRDEAEVEKECLIRKLGANVAKSGAK